MPTIVFQPSGRRVTVPAGTKLTDACRQAGVDVPVPCGERGQCGQCRVRLLHGHIPVDRRQRTCLPEDLLRAGWRSACVAEVHGDLDLADPAPAAEAVLTDFLAREPDIDPGVQVREVVMDPPSPADRQDDAARLLDALGSADAGQRLTLDPAVLPRLPGILRSGGFRCRATIVDRTVVYLDRADAPSTPALGLAVDIGTTTLAAALCDLTTGAVLAVASGGNPQAAHGDDVLSRIEYASRGPAELAALQTALVRALETVTQDAVRAAGTDRPAFLVVAANTVMTHLLLGVPPGSLALSPFVPVFREGLVVDARRLGWRDDRPPVIRLLPAIAGFVGGDITAGLVAHGLATADDTVLYLDVGTNGEIVLAHNGTLSACATAAGPAFEGARIRHGMRAAAGAISRVALADGRLAVDTVDGVLPPRGICGTGLLDAVAVLRRTGLLDAGGRLRPAGEIRHSRPALPPELPSRLQDGEDGRCFWLERPGGRGSTGVAVSQPDLREVQMAKGAIAAGTRVLMAVAGIGPEEVDRVLLAGGFGTGLDPDSALTIGLLPAGVARDRVRSVGNAALAGARACLLSRRERAVAEDLARRVRYIELSGRADFEAAFAEEMLFPAVD